VWIILVINWVSNYDAYFHHLKTPKAPYYTCPFSVCAPLQAKLLVKQADILIYVQHGANIVPTILVTNWREKSDFYFHHLKTPSAPCYTPSCSVRAPQQAKLLVKHADILIYVQHCADNTSHKLRNKNTFFIFTTERPSQCPIIHPSAAFARPCKQNCSWNEQIITFSCRLVRTLCQ